MTKKPGGLTPPVKEGGQRRLLCLHRMVSVCRLFSTSRASFKNCANIARCIILKRDTRCFLPLLLPNKVAHKPACSAMSSYDAPMQQINAYYEPLLNNLRPYGLKDINWLPNKVGA
jgi:hypothetical protein